MDSIPQMPDMPNISEMVGNGFFKSWTFSENAFRASDLLRGFLSNMPDFVQVFLILAFSFFIFGLLFKLLKEIL